VRYLATLIGAGHETVLRWFILVFALLLDPAAVALGSDAETSVSAHGPSSAGRLPASHLHGGSVAASRLKMFAMTCDGC